MALEKNTWQQLSLALILTVGLALIWGMLAGWGLSILEKKVWPNHRIYESIAVTNEGTPLISTQTTDGFNHHEITYRTLDGLQATASRNTLLDGANVQAPAKLPSSGVGPVKWQYRITGISDLGRPPVAWYLVRDAQPLGHAYLEGYDQQTKLLVGYLGRNGFASSVPPKEEQFEHNTMSYGWMQGSVCTTGYLSGGNEAVHYHNSADFEQDFPKWVLFLVDGNRLQEVNLRTRKVKTLYQSPDLLGVSLLATREAMAKGDKEGDKEKMERRLMLRLTDRILLLDRATSEEQQYLLPESMQKLVLSVYSIDNGQLLMVSQNYGAEVRNRNQHELIWFSPTGQMVQHKEVSLAWLGPSMSDQAQSAMVSLVAPIPLGWMVGGSIVAPLVMIQDNQVPNYSAGLQKIIAEGWPGLMISTLLAFASAGFTLRLHHRYHRPHPSLWCWFVFLLGPAGLMAYWLGHHRASLETCSACGRTVPRDRDGCAACGETFAAPELIGTEVFA
jgi:hypothetical protein